MDILLRLSDQTESARSVYVTDFEPELLRRSGEFYETEAGEVLERGDAAIYLRNVSPVAHLLLVAILLLYNLLCT